MLDLLERIKAPVYFTSIALLYGCYFAVFFKLVSIPHRYVYLLQTFVHVFVCLFLLLRFNPLIHPVLRKYDANIIFASAVLLLSNVVLIHPETTLAGFPGVAQLQAAFGA